MLAGEFDRSDISFTVPVSAGSNKGTRIEPSATTLGPVKKLLWTVHKVSGKKLSAFQLQWETPLKPATSERWYFIMTNAAWMVGVRYVDAARDIDVVVVFDKANTVKAADPLTATRQTFVDAGVAEEDMPEFVAVTDFALQYPGLYSDGFDLKVSREALNAYVEAGFDKVAAAARAAKEGGTSMADGMKVLGGFGGAGDADVRHALAAMILWYSESVKLTPAHELCAEQLQMPGSTKYGPPLIEGTEQKYDSGKGSPQFGGLLPVLQNLQNDKSTMFRDGYAVVHVQLPNEQGTPVNRVFALVTTEEEPGFAKITDRISKNSAVKDAYAQGKVAIEPATKLWKYVA